MNKVIIITGATSGIGLTTAKMLLAKGEKVYGISKSALPETENNAFVSYVANVNDTEACAKIFQEIYEKEGQIDVLINNAGYGIAGAIEETDPSLLYKNIETNLSAVLALSAKIIPFLQQTKGKIINISSVGGVVPLPFQACYSATKAGVEMFSRALANEVKPYGIHVSAVLPGDTKTPFTTSRVTQQNTKTRYGNRVSRSIGKMERDEQKGKSPESVGKVICKILRRKNPPLRVSVGFVAKAEVLLTRLLPTKLVNAIVYKMYG